ncbi:unnamed protein product [Sphagnum troendelagicum]|uniref:Sec-independent protein translocase protein TatB n=1 Tax=Sphagnum troendelagicum TaxID=128251 RepID=A0ABP0U721_9BRYO
MVLGLSWGQLALVLGASVALFGPKDIVLIGRAAGKLTGKAVGYIQTARGQFDPILQRSEINTVHKELQETMAQLEAIRHEMRTGLSILNPGPMTRQVMDSAAPGLLNPVEIKETGDCAELQRASQNEIRTEPRTMHSATVSPEVAVVPSGLTASLQVSESQGSEDARNRTSPQEVVILPISAVDAGLLPSKPALLSGGADLVFASVVERKVAFDSKKFLEQGEL